MKIILTKKGEEIKVDKADYDFLSRHNWWVDASGYARTSLGGKFANMHVLVIGTVTPGKVIDHINRDKLDNRRENLRAVSQQHNSLNIGKFNFPTARKYKSPYVGVFHKHHAKETLYEAGISLKNRYFYLGRFKTELEAAEQRDAFAYKVHGDIVFLNFPEKKEVYKAWVFNDRVLARYEKWG